MLKFLKEAIHFSSACAWSQQLRRIDCAVRRDSYLQRRVRASEPAGAWRASRSKVELLGVRGIPELPLLAFNNKFVLGCDREKCTLSRAQLEVEIHSFLAVAR